MLRLELILTVLNLGHDVRPFRISSVMLILLMLQQCTFLQCARMLARVKESMKYGLRQAILMLTLLLAQRESELYEHRCVYRSCDGTLTDAYETWKSRKPVRNRASSLSQLHRGSSIHWLFTKAKD
jgi:hypothetical protein